MREDAAVGEALVLVAALADLEEPHIIVLDRIAADAVPPQSTWSTDTEPRGWEATHLAQVFPAYKDIVDGLMAVLAGHGLIRALGDSTWDGSARPRCSP